MPGVLNPGASLVGGMAMLLILYLANILLILPYVVCVYGRYAVEMGLSSDLIVLVAGFMARKC